MSMHRASIHRALIALAFTALTWGVGAWAPSHAGTVDLSNTPPDLNKSVEPNIVLTFDDSGSMMATAMPDGIASDYKKKYYYSSTTNTIYYNPDITYYPPLHEDGTSFPNSQYDDAWRDGICANMDGSYCYSSPRKTNLSDNFYYRFVNGTSTSHTSNDKGQYDIPESLRTVGSFTYNGGAYFNCPTPKSEAGCTPILMNLASDEQRQNFANWYSYYRTRNLMARTAVMRAFGSLDSAVRVAWQTINHDTGHLGNSAIKEMSGQWRKDFFDWIGGVRTTGNTPNRRATLRVGTFFSRSLSKDDKDPYWNGKTGKDSADLSCRQNFHMLVTDGYWNYSSNPSKPGGYFTAETARTLPDGTAYDPTASVSTIFGNVAGTSWEPSLANIAWFYWAQDLQPTLANNVPGYYPDLSTGVTASESSPDASKPGDTPEVYWNPANDPATWQHVVQYMITLGVGGKLDFPGDLTALRKGTIKWPNPQNNKPEAIDDTWHAAINSRGQYLSASDPQSLVDKLTSVIQSIAQRTSSNVSVSLSSNVATVGSKSYAAGFNSANWSGTLSAQTVNEDGTLGATLWEAGKTLTDDTNADGGNRRIYTSDATGAGNGVDFEWGKLSKVEQAWMDLSPASGTPKDDHNGKERVAWLRGDRSKENTEFRPRTTLLGAIINSQPVVNSYPSSGFRNYFPPLPNGDDAPEVAAYKASADNSYAAFVRDHLTRAPTVYVGANDGMLHAFDATKAGNGAERWAYVPYGVYPHLSQLMAKENFQFVPTVDGSPTVGDAFFDDAWHTILVGGLRFGGRGLYALDITKRDGSVSAKDRVLWEFTPNEVSLPPTCKDKNGGPKDSCMDKKDNGKHKGWCKDKKKHDGDEDDDDEDDDGKHDRPCPPESTSDPAANLGYTFGQPQIARIAYQGKWAVIVSGGYFPDGSTAPAASNDFSSLFILDAQTGAVIKEMKTSSWDEGKVTSYGLAVPVVGDYENDQVADVAFAGDVQGNLWRFDFSAPDPADWKVSLVYKPDTPGAQPITSEPRLFPTPYSNDFTVVFGTGKYLGASDRTNDSSGTQAVYGVREKGTSASSTAVITRDDLVQQTLYDDGNGTRALSNRAAPPDKDGWYFNLDLTSARGERVVTTPFALFSTGQALISTLIPGSSNPCDPSRSGALMLVNAANGGASDGLDYPSWTGDLPDGANVAGGRVANSPTSGTLPVASLLGGGAGVVVGMSYENGEGKKSQAGGNFFPLSKRRDWRAIEKN